jgi:hypothetical protein
MSLHKSTRASSSVDTSEITETRSGLWWSIAEFTTLAAVALAAGFVIFYIRWPGARAQSTIAEKRADVLEEISAPAASDRVVWEYATNDDLVRLNEYGAVRELVIEDSNITDEGLVHLQQFHELEQLKIRGAAITDVGLSYICALPNLRYLNLPQANFTDAGLAKLAKLPHLELLRFGSPQVTNEGLATCAAMPNLRFLHLINVPVTDDGLDRLHQIKQLQSLYLDGTKVTELGLGRLLNALPGLHIHIDQRHLDRDKRLAAGG